MSESIIGYFNSDGNTTISELVSSSDLFRVSGSNSANVYDSINLPTSAFADLVNYEAYFIEIGLSEYNVPASYNSGIYIYAVFPFALSSIKIFSIVTTRVESGGIYSQSTSDDYGLLEGNIIKMPIGFDVKIESVMSESYIGIIWRFYGIRKQN